MHRGRIAVISVLAILCAVGALESTSATALVTGAVVAIAACFAMRREGGGFVIALLAAAHAVGVYADAAACAGIVLFGSMCLFALEIAWGQDARERRWCERPIPPARVR